MGPSRSSSSARSSAAEVTGRTAQGWKQASAVAGGRMARAIGRVWSAPPWAIARRCEGSASHASHGTLLVGRGAYLRGGIDTHERPWAKGEREAGALKTRGMGTACMHRAHIPHQASRGNARMRGNAHMYRNATCEGARTSAVGVENWRAAWLIVQRGARTAHQRREQPTPQRPRPPPRQKSPVQHARSGAGCLEGVRTVV